MRWPYWRLKAIYSALMDLLPEDYQVAEESLNGFKTNDEVEAQCEFGIVDYPDLGVYSEWVFRIVAKNDSEGIGINWEAWLKPAKSFGSCSWIIGPSDVSVMAGRI